jgi:hypothetical protein
VISNSGLWLLIVELAALNLKAFDGDLTKSHIIMDFFCFTWSDKIAQ